MSNTVQASEQHMATPTDADFDLFLADAERPFSGWDVAHLTEHSLERHRDALFHLHA